MESLLTGMHREYTEKGKTWHNGYVEKICPVCLRPYICARDVSGNVDRCGYPDCKPHDGETFCGKA